MAELPVNPIPGFFGAGFGSDGGAGDLFGMDPLSFGVGAASLFAGLFSGRNKLKEQYRLEEERRQRRMQELLARIGPLLKLQQQRMLLTDPGAAKLFPGVDLPEGAVPLRSAIAQMAWRNLPGFAREGLTLPERTGEGSAPASAQYGPYGRRLPGKGGGG